MHLITFNNQGSKLYVAFCLLPSDQTILIHPLRFIYNKKMRFIANEFCIIRFSLKRILRIFLEFQYVNMTMWVNFEFTLQIKICIYKWLLTGWPYNFIERNCRMLSCSLLYLLDLQHDFSLWFFLHALEIPYDITLFSFFIFSNERSIHQPNPLITQHLGSSYSD